MTVPFNVTAAALAIKNDASADQLGILLTLYCAAYALVTSTVWLQFDFDSTQFDYHSTACDSTSNDGRVAVQQQSNGRRIEVERTCGHRLIHVARDVNRGQMLEAKAEAEAKFNTDR